MSQAEEFRCLGCGSTFQKEQAFFKHATLVSSGSHARFKTVLYLNNPAKVIYGCESAKMCFIAFRLKISLSEQKWVFKDCFNENRFLGLTSTLETSFHADVSRHAGRNNL